MGLEEPRWQGIGGPSRAWPPPPKNPFLPSFARGWWQPLGMQAVAGYIQDPGKRRPFPRAKKVLAPFTARFPSICSADGWQVTCQGGDDGPAGGRRDLWPSPASSAAPHWPLGLCSSEPFLLALQATLSPFSLTHPPLPGMSPCPFSSGGSALNRHKSFRICDVLRKFSRVISLPTTTGMAGL